MERMVKRPRDTVTRGSWSFFEMSAAAQMVINPVRDEVVALNREARRLLGEASAPLDQRSVRQMFLQNLPALITFTQQLMDRGHGWSDELLLSKGAETLRVEVVGRYDVATSDSIIYFTLQPLDELDQHRKKSDAHKHYLSGISHWKRISRTFQEFERENRLLLDAVGEGIYGVDIEGKTTFVNPTAERILGYDAEELAGKNMHQMVHHSHADGSNFGADECPIFLAFKQGVVQEAEDDVFWTKSNQAVNVEYTSTPVLDNGEIVGAVVVFRDVSQKKVRDRELTEALAEVEQLKNRLEREKAYLQEEIKAEFNHHQMIGKSPALNQVLQQIDLVGPTDATVLINGETGTGKELIARALHESSSRSERALIRVNCAAIPQDLFESEFFGHVRGAFTGANSDRLGRFELADGGTLFLDEVGEIPIHLQGKLLRVLQEKQYERIGEAATHNVDVRIIAATNRNLKERVTAGEFREDLYFRLNVFPIESVALRKRREDIPMLTQHFLNKASVRSNRQGLRIPINEMEKLTRYSWPGNIRELENVVERQVILTRGDVVRFEGNHAEADPSAPVVSAPEKQGLLTSADLKQQDRRNIILALEQSGGKVFGKGGAAMLLQLKPTTLASRIKKYHIDTRDFRLT